MSDRIDAVEVEVPASRRRFLKRLGAAVAVGMGVALVPVTNAFATDRCCKSSSCPSCPPGQVAYSCGGSCGGSCCVCYTDIGNCFNTACPCGP
jgi:hypothetical protein